MADSLDDLKARIVRLKADFEAALGPAADATGLQSVRDRFLGRKAGAVTALLKGLGGLADEARRDAGRDLNELKDEFERKLESARAAIEAQASKLRLSRESIDVTLPGRVPPRGRRHPLVATREALEDVFISMGYEVYDGPEVEDDFHCFEALNMPPDHPARDMQDTFYVDVPGRSDLLLRTHTSSGQIRYMLENEHPPEVRIICPGKVYRRDNDITHSPMFQQIEGLVVGRGISVADLKGTIEAFLHRLFGPQYPVRFRCSYFPYTEPSVEADLGCIVCDGKGCRVCKHTGWIEILGSGMVDPAVFEKVNERLGRVVYDPEEVTGFAFGLGIDRVAMIRHGIDDIRLFYGGDLRFLEQFPGMKILLSWLREHVDVPVPVAKLAADLTEVGLAVDGIEPRGDDAILDLDITTNRVDCMNVRGVAREVSVIYGVPLKSLDISFDEKGSAASSALSVSIDAPDLCPRFAARVLDVKMGPSPAWLRERLEALGVRSISNVVDLTNYVMLELGQPTHAFDLAKIPDAELRVRWAREGETLRTLDGVERTLKATHGVVAGPKDALALAGIMGGASSEVSDATRTVALEAAYWDALSIRRGARALGMHTEASHRFERGADPEGPITALARLAHLLLKIGAGTTRPGAIDVRPAPRPVVRLSLRRERQRTVLGVDVPAARVREILTGLGFGVDPVEIEVPSWRGDVTREIDLVEEVGRHFGVNKIPSTLPPAQRPGGLRPAQQLERRLRDVLVGAGLSEVVSYSFVSRAAGPTLRLQNPLAEDQGVLRTSVLDPGLVDVLRLNLSHGRRDVRVFEIGRVFAPLERTLPREDTRLAFVLAGSRARHWSEKARPADFFDGRGLVELIASSLGWGEVSFERRADAPALLHPGRSAAVVVDGASIGWIGALHPEFAREQGLRDEAIVGELALSDLIRSAPKAERFSALPRQPGTSRDLSVLCEAEWPARELERLVRASAGALLREVTVSDRFEGGSLPAGKVSLTVTLRYQDDERTLTGEEVQQSVGAVVAALKGRGAEIRGE